MAQYLSSFRLESGGVEVTTVYHQPVLVHCCVVCRPNIDIYLCYSKFSDMQNISIN